MITVIINKKKRIKILRNVCLKEKELSIPDDSSFLAGGFRCNPKLGSHLIIDQFRSVWEYVDRFSGIVDRLSIDSTSSAIRLIAGNSTKYTLESWKLSHSWNKFITCGTTFTHLNEKVAFNKVGKVSIGRVISHFKSFFAPPTGYRT